MNCLVTPTNSKANNKTGDAASAGQAEQSVAFLGQNGLCAWNDGQGFNLSPQDVQGYGCTTNCGATWTDGGIPPKSGTIATWSGDPVVTVNEKTGDFYYCGMTTNSGTNNNGVAVWRGHFSGGTAWAASTAANSVAHSACTRPFTTWNGYGSGDAPDGSAGGHVLRQASCPRGCVEQHPDGRVPATGSTLPGSIATTVILISLTSRKRRRSILP